MRGAFVLVLVVFTVTGCGSCGPGAARDEPPPPRELGRIELGWHEVVVTARYEEGRTFGKAGARETISIRHATKIASGDIEQRFVWLAHPGVRVPREPTEHFTDRAVARRVFADLTLEHCRRGNEVIFIVREPSGTYRPYEPEDWQVLYFPDDDHAILSTFDPPGSDPNASCAAVAPGAPTLEEMLALAAGAGRNEACQELLATSQHAEAIRCALGGGAGDDAMNALTLAVGTSVAEDALYEALDVNAAGEPEARNDRRDNRRTARLLEAARDPAKKRRWVEAALEQCLASATPCPSHRMRAIGIAASQLADTMLCDRVLQLATRMLARPPHGAARALEALIGVQGCGTEAQWAELMRRSLGERSVPAEDVRRRGSEDSFVYSQCTADNLRITNRATSDCRSLPRWSAHWLSQHCDEAAVARAVELFAAAGAEPDRARDDVADAAMRVREACASAR